MSYKLPLTYNPTLLSRPTAITTTTPQTVTTPMVTTIIPVVNALTDNYTFRVQLANEQCACLDTSTTTFSSIDCTTALSQDSCKWMPIPVSANYWTLIGGTSGSTPGTFCYQPDQYQTTLTKGLCQINGGTTANTFSTASGQDALLSTLEEINSTYCTPTGGAVLGGADVSTEAGTLITLFCKNYFEDRVGKVADSTIKITSGNDTTIKLNNYKWYIIIGVIVFILFIILLIYLIRRRNRQKKVYQSEFRKEVSINSAPVVATQVEEKPVNVY